MEETPGPSHEYSIESQLAQASDQVQKVVDHLQNIRGNLSTAPEWLNMRSGFKRTVIKTIVLMCENAVGICDAALEVAARLQAAFTSLGNLFISGEVDEARELAYTIQRLCGEFFAYVNSAQTVINRISDFAKPFQKCRTRSGLLKMWMRIVMVVAAVVAMVALGAELVGMPLLIGGFIAGSSTIGTILLAFTGEHGQKVSIDPSGILSDIQDKLEEIATFQPTLQQTTNRAMSIVDENLALKKEVEELKRASRIKQNGSGCEEVL